LRVLDCLAFWYWRLVVWLLGGDAVKRSPEHPAQRTRSSSASKPSPIRCGRGDENVWICHRRTVEAGFEKTGEEGKLAELHDLDDEQIAWRRAKISQLGTDHRFDQEYPLTPSEAFVTPDLDSFISPELVLNARREGDAWGPPQCRRFVWPMCS
jgi:hypothetical protein